MKLEHVTVPSVYKREFSFAGHVIEETVHKERWVCTGRLYSGLSNVWTALARCKNTLTFTLGWYSECATACLFLCWFGTWLGCAYFCLFPLTNRTSHHTLCLPPNTTSDYLHFSSEHFVMQYCHVPAVICYSRIVSVSSVISETPFSVARGSVKGRQKAMQG